MEIISFDLVGKFAHFRKFYSNSTALSFTIPPRTSIIGMIASFLGKERDSYYEEFSSENILIGLAVKTPIKKSFHRLNLLKIGSTSDFRGKAGRTQIPMEIITGEDIRKQDIVYRIFVGHTNKGKEVFSKIKEAFLIKCR